MPGIIRKIEHPQRLERRTRVAAYARVSSGKDAMLHSLSAQVSYYSAFIQQHPGWQYCGVYADEALTGTKEDRDGFQRLLTDCRNGQVDIVITKSISRFARNTVTLLETVRELKALGVDVFFEEQDIHSLSTDGELMLTILASYAQEESLSASENQKWWVRKSFENGELVNWRFMFGYTISKDGIQINPSEATVVQEIFQRALAGETFGAICRDLNARGIQRPFDGPWDHRRIRALLENEKYTGNALLQKRYRNNHLEKKLCHNCGELPKYYATESHPAIIDATTFQAAQDLLTRLSEQTAHRAKPQLSEFAGMILCPHCGKAYKRVTSNGSVGWNCRTYQEKGKRFCRGKKIPEDTLKVVCADVLSLETYNADVFMTQVESIVVPDDNRLCFHLKDGHLIEHTWADRSRADSWQPDMKESARQRMLNRRHH
ncbi:MAG: recombinase family protein [Eubacteriales bacterium]|nr:recombinase family protein [Eubacteriales bacterium]